MVILYIKQDGSNATCPIDYKIRWPPVKQDERADQGCSSQLRGAILRQENQFWYSPVVLLEFSLVNSLLFCRFFSGLECVGHSFAYVANFIFLRDVWIRTQWADVASRRAYQLSHPSPPLSYNPFSSPSLVLFSELTVLPIFLDFSDL